MRVFIALSALAIILSGVATAATAPQITNYAITVDFAATDTLLHISTEVDITADSVDHFDFVFSSLACGLALEAAGNTAPLALPWRRLSNDSLRVELPEELRTSGWLRLSFRYDWLIPRSPDNIYLSRGHRWYPQILDQVAPYYLTVNLPDNYICVSGGEQTSQTTIPPKREAIWESRVPMFKIELAILKQPPFSDGSIDSNDIAYHFVSPRPVSNTSRAILDEAAGEVEYFSYTIGSTELSRLTVLEIGNDPGTNIGTGILVLGKPSVDAFFSGYKDEMRLSIAAQWFGAGVFPKYRSTGWWFLQLSLPHYLRLMYTRAADGDSAYAAQLASGLKAYEAAATSDQDVPIMQIDMPNTRAKATAIYGKGPAILDLIAKQMGETRWQQLLRSFYFSNRGKTVKVEDFIRAVEENDPSNGTGERLRSLLTSTGLPQ